MVTPDSGKETAKDAPKTMPTARKNTLDDDEGKTLTGLQLKQKFLPTGLSRAIVLATVIASFAMIAGTLFAGRYDLVPAPNSANSFMYRLDKLTGRIQFCGPQGCSDIPQAEK